ncbi:DUF4381 domain-containing protein [Vibrio sp. VB16]|uniref:DUF4381 domain-containing protein n=1 Tax=Vibrio sp. VB16 TaxID=2785746 RepID=UPI00189F68BF|nr:DUF4381 domain-containing protein [Vibrio sp. VB16]UGA56693.1 DUF4381 domain-containing protein [Vibrio sp. VB16]
MTEATAVAHPLSLEAIHLPSVPGFWPFPWGWWSLLASFIFTILFVIVIWKWRKRRLRAKKAAIALLSLEKNQITPSGAMEILRQAVLSYYPRGRVAHLSGENWLVFLDSQVKTPIFETHEKEWTTALYQKESRVNRDMLVAQCETWLNAALPPKKGGRG